MHTTLHSTHSMTLAAIVSGVTGWDGRAGLLRAAGRCYRLGRHGDLRLFLLVLLGHGIFFSLWHMLCRADWWGGWVGFWDEMMTTLALAHSLTH